MRDEDKKKLPHPGDGMVVGPPNKEWTKDNVRVYGADGKEKQTMNETARPQITEKIAQYLLTEILPTLAKAAMIGQFTKISSLCISKFHKLSLLMAMKKDVTNGKDYLKVHCGNPLCPHPAYLFRYADSAVIRSLESNHPIYIARDDIEDFAYRLLDIRDEIDTARVNQSYETVAEENVYYKSLKENGDYLEQARQGAARWGEIIRSRRENANDPNFMAQSDALEAEAREELKFFEEILVYVNSRNDNPDAIMEEVLSATGKESNGLTVDPTAFSPYGREF